MNKKELYRGVGVLWLIFLTIGTTTSCTVGPDFEQPELESVMQEQWNTVEKGQHFSEFDQPFIRWWEQFNDDELTRLIEQVFSSSLALKQARQRVVEVSARQGVVTAERRMQLSAALGYTRVETGDEAVSLQGIPAGKTVDVFSTGVVAGWELDLWGRIARLTEAAEEDIRVGYADYQGLLVSLAAETALSYIELRTVEDRIEMVKDNIDLQIASLDLATTRFEAGIGNELAVVRIERLVESSRARLPELARELSMTRNHIKVLLGQPPATENPGPGEIPEVPALIGIGLPTDLLTRRPDIRRALSVYHAAVARIGAVEAEQYPTLSLSGYLTLSSDTIGGVFDSDAIIYSLGPGLKFPILTGSRIRSTIAVRESQAEQARLAMEQCIIEALSEVENSAEGVVRSQQQAERLFRAEKLAKKSVKLADELYQAGVADFSQVLDSKQQLLENQEVLLLAKQQALSQVIRLYRALGGGWEQAPLAMVETEDNIEKQGSTH
ncbi:MAG: multidrug efflux system outer membrane protein [Desulforhopalus sp.]|jgi:multidrug efflux system outer membrane protein